MLIIIIITNLLLYTLCYWKWHRRVRCRTLCTQQLDSKRKYTETELWKSWHNCTSPFEGIEGKAPLLQVQKAFMITLLT